MSCTHTWASEHLYHEVKVCGAVVTVGTACLSTRFARSSEPHGQAAPFVQKAGGKCYSTSLNVYPPLPSTLLLCLRGVFFICCYCHSKEVKIKLKMLTRMNFAPRLSVVQCWFHTQDVRAFPSHTWSQGHSWRLLARTCVCLRPPQTSGTPLSPPTQQPSTLPHVHTFYPPSCPMACW